MIIINSDLDGFLCGLLLHHYFQSHIIGFSNSADTIWVDQAIKDKEKALYNPVYVDMFVADNAIVSIDNHIIAANKQHWQLLRQNPNKLNPNLQIDYPRCFSSPHSYKNKYCLATFHFLCGLIEKEVGEKIVFDLDKRIGKTNKLGDLILRADKTMVITLLDYTENARWWWKWLRDISPNGIISNFIQYLGKIPTDMVGKINQNVSTRLLNKPYYCDSNDGGYKHILDKEGFLLDKMKTLIQTLAKVTCLNCFPLDRQYNAFVGEAVRTHISRKDIEIFSEELIKNQTVNGRKVFSYSFVNSTHNKNVNFSYTTFENIKSNESHG